MPFQRRFGPLLAMMAAPAMLAVLVASYAGFWFFNAQRVKDRLAAWSDARRAEGWQIAYVIDGTSGFPTGISLRLKAVSLTTPPRDGGAWSLAAPEAAIGLALFSPNRLKFTLPRGAQLSNPSPDAPTRLTETDGALGLTVDVDGSNALRRVAVEGDGVKIDGAWRGIAFASPLAAAQVRGGYELLPPPKATAANAPAAGGEPPASATAAIGLRDVEWPDNFDSGLGAKMEMFGFAARLLGPLPPAGPFAETLPPWRDAGGRVAIDRIDLKWGVAGVSGYGSLLMDSALQPAVSLTARVEGFIPLVDMLAATDLIRPRDATLARLVIGRQLPQSGAANLSLTLRDGTVYAGPLALLQVPAIVWAGRTGDGQPLTPSGQPLMRPGADIDRNGNVRRKGDPL